MQTEAEHKTEEDDFAAFVSLNVYKDGLTGSLQLSVDYEDGCGGHGYRLAGPKFAGKSKLLLRRALNQSDISELRTYLDDAERLIVSAEQFAERSRSPEVLSGNGPEKAATAEPSN